MCCQMPTPPQSLFTPCPQASHLRNLPLWREFFRAPTVLTGILPGNRAQVSGLWRCFRSFGPRSLTNNSTTLPYESRPCLLCRHQPCLSTGSSLPTCQLTLQHVLFCKSHCRASLQYPRARLPLRHNPPPPPHHHSRARAGVARLHSHFYGFSSL